MCFVLPSHAAVAAALVGKMLVFVVRVCRFTTTPWLFAAVGRRLVLILTMPDKGHAHTHTHVRRGSREREPQQAGLVPLSVPPPARRARASARRGLCASLTLARCSVSFAPPPSLSHTAAASHQTVVFGSHQNFKTFLSFLGRPTATCAAHTAMPDARASAMQIELRRSVR